MWVKSELKLVDVQLYFFVYEDLMVKGGQARGQWNFNLEVNIRVERGVRRNQARSRESSSLW